MFEYYHCEKLETTLNFTPDLVRFCCGYMLGPGFDIKSISSIKEIQNRYIKLMKKGQIPCFKCIECKEIGLKEHIKNLFCKKRNKKFSYIIVNHYKQCDCSCIYCSQKEQCQEQIQNYELLPIIKNLYEEKLIDKKNLVVEFQGGNISVLKEFESLIKEFYSQGCEKFIIFMNAIKYLPIFDELGNKVECSFIISLDSGTKETFAKIKQVDAFEQTINNIKKLKEKPRFYIALKYIILDNVNDNADEMKKFLSVASNVKADTVMIDIDYHNTCLSFGKRFDVPKHYYELFKLAEVYCAKRNIRYDITPFTRDILDKGYSI